MIMIYIFRKGRSMIVKFNGKQLSFLFQENDPFFDMGYIILDQANILDSFPYKRTIQGEKEKLVFDTSSYKPVIDVIKELNENEIVDIIYSIIYMTKKVEENGFLKKSSIWCKYEHIFYNKKNGKVMMAVLPVTGEVHCADGLDWNTRFKEAVSIIAQPLNDEKYNTVINCVVLLLNGQMTCEKALDIVDGLRNGRTGLLMNEKDNEYQELNLIYSGREGTSKFVIKDKDFVIGRSPEGVDGNLQLSKAVSRQHCLITKLDRRYFVQDLGSSNHTFVNGVMIPRYELMEIKHNDILGIADVDFRVKIIKNTTAGL